MARAVQKPLLQRAIYHREPVTASLAIVAGMDQPQPLTIVLLGPTASGKTALAIELAKALDLAVLNVDSRQLYLHMDVGTAKPSPAQRAEVRHELLDLREPNNPINLQDFRAIAEPAIAAEHQRRGMALLAGGSGLYIKGLTQGMEPPAVPPQPVLRAQLAELGQATCHQLLTQADPIAAARIGPADGVRTQRALEVIYATGQSLTSQQHHSPPPWRVLELGLNPSNGRQRITERTQALYRDGLVAETNGLIERYGADLPLLQTIGYGEAQQVLTGDLSEQAAIEITTQRTCQFAKRQRTWFRRQHQPIWIGGSDPDQQCAQCLQELARVLG